MIAVIQKRTQDVPSMAVLCTGAAADFGRGIASTNCAIYYWQVYLFQAYLKHPRSDRSISHSYLFTFYSAYSSAEKWELQPLD